LEHLIPEEWFTGLPWWSLLLISGGAVAMLVKGADWLVEGASGLAYRMGIPKVIVGATIVSLGTTSPECAVSVMAAWSGNSALALGNAVGSIIADTGLIFGLGCLLTTLPADRFVLNRQGWTQFGCALLLAAFCYGAWIVEGDGARIGRYLGFLFLALLIVYMVISVRWARKHPHGEPFQMHHGRDGPEKEQPTTGKTAEPARKSHALLMTGMMVVGLVLVILSSRVLVCAVTELARQWGVPNVVIAATLVAVGTSLPELVVGMASIIKGHREILVGNVIGADILNVLFVIGASAAVTPLPVIEPEAKVPEIFLYMHLPAMILILFTFRISIWSAVKRGQFRRWFGIPLLLIYAVFVTLTYLVST